MVGVYYISDPSDILSISMFMFETRFSFFGLMVWQLYRRSIRFECFRLSLARFDPGMEMFYMLSIIIESSWEFESSWSSELMQIMMFLFCSYGSFYLCIFLDFEYLDSSWLSLLDFVFLNIGGLFCFWEKFKPVFLLSIFTELGVTISFLCLDIILDLFEVKIDLP